MCGAVRYKISAAPIATGLCHCNRCRPQSGSTFSTIIIIGRSTFQPEGETMVFEDIGASGKRVGRRCCARCGSPLTTASDVTPEYMFVKAGGIDNNEWFKPRYGAVRHEAPALGASCTRRPTIRSQSTTLRDETINPFEDLFDRHKRHPG